MGSAAAGCYTFRVAASRPTSPDALADLGRRASQAGLDAGLDAVGITSAEPFDDARRSIEARIAAGQQDSMAFTFRNPARSTDPRRTLRDAATMVVGARSYRREDMPATASPAGRVARYAWVDHYAPLKAALRAVGDVLRGEGFRTVVLADDNSLVDRAAAHRAGIGWYGKNANLLLPGRGSWFVLGSVVTDAPLPVASAPVDDGCGTCVRCLDGCPTAAIVAPGVVDARRCLAWLAQRPGVFPHEFRVALGDRIYGCDDCQEVCPPNRTFDRRNAPPPAESDAQPWVGLVELLDASDAALLAAHGRFYLPERNVATLRRNALLALGNLALGNLGIVGNRGNPLGHVVATGSAVAEIRRVVQDALVHRDPVVRGAAVWACGRLGCVELCDELRRSEADPDVRAELALIERSGTAR